MIIRPDIQVGCVSGLLLFHFIGDNNDAKGLVRTSFRSLSNKGSRTGGNYCFAIVLGAEDGVPHPATDRTYVCI